MRHGLVVFAFVLVAGLLLSGDLDAGSLEPPGPPAPTMKTLSQVEARTPISSLPITIAAPGSYYLTGNLTGVSGQVGITITSSFVTLDLNGYSLIGVPGTLDGIRATVAGTRAVVIRNGVIRGWGGSGISAFNASGVDAENLRFDSNGGSGLIVGLRSIVRNTTSTLNSVNGIEVSAGSKIIGCTAMSNTLSGIVAQGNTVVSNSTASNNGSAGIQLNGVSLATDCSALQNQTGFILGGGARVVHSVASTNTSGIVANGEGAAIEGCTVDGNVSDGIRILSRGLVRGNLVRNHANNGIQATGVENRIEDNESTLNGVGILVSGTNNLVVRNSVGSNGTEYIVFPGNQLGPVSADPATAGPWANFDL